MICEDCGEPCEHNICDNCRDNDSDRRDFTKEYSEHYEVIYAENTDFVSEAVDD